MKLLIILLLWAGLLHGRVVKVVDGDTLRVRTVQGIRSVRLDSIDAPEKRQPGGKASRQALQMLVPVNSEVDVLDLGEDRYQRMLGQVYLPDGTNVNSLQVRSGNAWVFRRYCRDPIYWIPLEVSAQKAHLGLWVHSNPVAPWEFRRPK